MRPLAPKTASFITSIIPYNDTGDTTGATPAWLDLAHQGVGAAGIGVFNPANLLRFEAFEIRYLGRREPPSRAVIDLSGNDDVILRPQSYFRIPNPEDRLFSPMVFVPLFVWRGWRLEGWS